MRSKPHPPKKKRQPSQPGFNLVATTELNPGLLTATQRCKEKLRGFVSMEKLSDGRDNDAKSSETAAISAMRLLHEKARVIAVVNCRADG